MASFRFEAADSAGRVERGLIDAESARAARSTLRTRGLVPLAVAAVDVGGGTQPAPFRGRRFPEAELALATRQFSSLLAAQLPPGPAFYPDGELTDEPEEVLMAELIREAALEGVRDELPHSLAVVIEEVSPREGRDDLVDVHANLFVERESQKGIVIGAKGSRLRRIGSQSREQIERLLGTPVYLDLRVKVAKDWQRDPRQLRRLGY